MNQSTTISVAIAGDDNYAAPMAVTVRSILETLAPTSRLELWIIDGGLSDENKRRLLASWDDRVAPRWVTPDLDRLASLPVSHHVSLSTYLRLLLPTLLPDEVGRLIYLDCDMLVRRDLTHLWNEPQGDHPVLAAQDVAMPWMDAELTTENFARKRRYLVATRPVRNYRELGLRPQAGYFNAGMMVVDLACWRREGLSLTMLDCLANNRESVDWWDQYALNVVLSDRWRAVDPRWNQSAYVYAYPSWRECALQRSVYEQAISDPWIVHFCSSVKPWHYFSDHPFRRDYFATLDRTEWRGWRPERPAGALRQSIKLGQKRVERAIRNRVRYLMANASEALRRSA